MREKACVFYDKQAIDFVMEKPGGGKPRHWRD
jgi:hypothetical protein